MADKFSFFKSFSKALKRCNPEDGYYAILALCDKIFDGEDPEGLSDMAMLFYELALPNVESSQKKQDDGAKGGRPSKSTSAETTENHRSEDPKPTFSNSKTSDEGGFQNEKPTFSNSETSNESGFEDPKPTFSDSKTSEQGGFQNAKAIRNRNRNMDKDMDLVCEGLDLHNPPPPSPIPSAETQFGTGSPICQPNAPPASWPVHPSVEEVRKLCTENGLSVDAEKFVAHYDSMGWTVNRRPIMDWRARCMVWHRDNVEKEAEKARASPKGKPDKFRNFEERDYDMAELEARFAKNRDVS